MLSLVERLGIVVEEGRISGIDEAIVNIQRLYLLCRVSAKSYDWWHRQANVDVEQCIS